MQREELELCGIIDVLQRAIALLEREMAKSASTPRLKRTGTEAQAFECHGAGLRLQFLGEVDADLEANMQSYSTVLNAFAELTSKRRCRATALRERPSPRQESGCISGVYLQSTHSILGASSQWV